MNSNNENLPQPSIIKGYDRKIMVSIAEFVEKHEPINDYFDPVIELELYEKNKHNLSIFERIRFEKEYPKLVVKQRAAFAETFKILEKFLTENPDLDLNIIDELYFEMSKLYGFNYDMNQTYIRFRTFYEESRKYLNYLRHKFPNDADLFYQLTGFTIKDPNSIKIEKGPFAFEIRASQEILNLFQTNPNDTFFRRLREKIIPSTSLSGINAQFSNPKDERVTGNFIIYPKKDPIVDFFRVFDTYLDEKNLPKSLSKYRFRPKKTVVNQEIIKEHENQHALYNLIMSAERMDKQEDIITTVDSILKSDIPSVVKKEDFSNFCNFLVENAFYIHAAHEILARIKEGNFIPSIFIINNPEAYNFIENFVYKANSFENKYIQAILNVMLNPDKNPNNEEFKIIYNSFAQNAKLEIYTVTMMIARFLEEFPNENKGLTNQLMFLKFSDWKKEILRYSRYLRNK